MKQFIKKVFFAQTFVAKLRFFVFQNIAGILLLALLKNFPSSNYFSKLIFCNSCTLQTSEAFLNFFYAMPFAVGGRRLAVVGWQACFWVHSYWAKVTLFTLQTKFFVSQNLQTFRAS